jgi:hypothetical protein
MNSQILDEIMEELSSTLERVETQSAAVLEFLKAKGIAKDDELAPYLERAATASGVRWRAERVRLAHLLSGLEKSERQAQEKSSEPKNSKEAQETKKSPSIQESNDKSGAPEKLKGTESDAGEGPQSRGGQKHDTSSNSDPKAGQRKDGAPSPKDKAA